MLDNSPVLQNARPRAVAVASCTGVDKITQNTAGITRKDICMTKPSTMQVIILK